MKLFHYLAIHKWILVVLVSVGAVLLYAAALSAPKADVLNQAAGCGDPAILTITLKDQNNQPVDGATILKTDSNEQETTSDGGKAKFVIYKNGKQSFQVSLSNSGMSINPPTTEELTIEELDGAQYFYDFMETIDYHNTDGTPTAAPSAQPSPTSFHSTNTLNSLLGIQTVRAANSRTNKKPGPGPATGVIAGYVKDAKTGEGINGATVTLLPDNKVYTSTKGNSKDFPPARDGYFVFSGMPLGCGDKVFTVKAKKDTDPKYAEASIEITLSPQNNANKNVELKLSPIIVSGKITVRSFAKTTPQIELTDENTPKNGVPVYIDQQPSNGPCTDDPIGVAAGNTKLTVDKAPGTYCVWINKQLSLADGTYILDPLTSSPARNITVTAGQTALVQFAFKKQPVASLQGKAIDADPSKPSPNRKGKFIFGSPNQVSEHTESAIYKQGQDPLFDKTYHMTFIPDEKTVRVVAYEDESGHRLDGGNPLGGASITITQDKPDRTINVKLQKIADVSLTVTVTPPADDQPPFIPLPQNVADVFKQTLPSPPGIKGDILDSIISRLPGGGIIITGGIKTQIYVHVPSNGYDVLYGGGSLGKRTQLIKEPLPEQDINTRKSVGIANNSFSGCVVAIKEVKVFGKRVKADYYYFTINNISIIPLLINPDPTIHQGDNPFPFSKQDIVTKLKLSGRNSNVIPVSGISKGDNPDQTTLSKCMGIIPGGGGDGTR